MSIYVIKPKCTTLHRQPLSNFPLLGQTSQLCQKAISINTFCNCNAYVSWLDEPSLLKFYQDISFKSLPLQQLKTRIEDAQVQQLGKVLAIYLTAQIRFNSTKLLKHIVKGLCL
jgi:hypothetical protein